MVCIESVNWVIWYLSNGGPQESIKGVRHWTTSLEDASDISRSHWWRGQQWWRYQHCYRKVNVEWEKERWREDGDIIDIRERGIDCSIHLWISLYVALFWTCSSIFSLWYIVCFCLFFYLRIYVPLENFSLVCRSWHYRWRAVNIDLYSALMAIEHWGFFSVPYLLWHGTSVYNGHIRRTVTLTPTLPILTL